MIGTLMIIGPFVFCLYPEYNRSEDKPEEMGRAMFICIAAGVLAIVNTLLLGAFYLNKKLNSVPDLVSCNHSRQFRNNIFFVFLGDKIYLN